MTDIAVIGGGAAGAAVFGELLRRRDYRTIHWVAGQRPLGRGVAYATDDDDHLLNVRAGGMGVFVEQEEDFVQHASRQRAEIKGTDFLPRRFFGDFVEAQMHAHIERARQQGRGFAIHEGFAQAIHRRDGGYEVILGGGERLPVGAAVLAVGALAQRPLRTVSAEALASNAYELDPWRLGEHGREPRRVLVIGTGLTAVDTLISAAKRWPRAELTAVSRHGLLPFTHPASLCEPYRHQAELNERLLACDNVFAMLGLIREAMDDAADWRGVVDGMRPINACLWQALAHKERKRFLRHLRWVWESSRHRMAPATAAAIRQLRESGRLRVRAARVLRVDGNAPLQVTVRGRADQRVDVLETDLAVQATGLDTAVAFTKDRLLSQLFREGLAVADALELGIATSPDGQLLDARGQPQRGLYAIGSLLRGTLWESTAMPEIRAMAHRLVRVQLPPGGAGAATPINPCTLPA